MLNERKWTILGFISSDRPISELKPPLTDQEREYYKKNKDAAECIKKKLRPGIRFQFVPPDDMDYDEANETWP